MHATQLPFALIPGVPAKNPPTSVKLPGTEGRRVDILAPGPLLGEIVAVPELEWHAQTIPFYDYLLEGSRAAAQGGIGQDVTPEQFYAIVDALEAVAGEKPLA